MDTNLGFSEAGLAARPDAAYLSPVSPGSCDEGGGQEADGVREKAPEEEVVQYDNPPGDLEEARPVRKAGDPSLPSAAMVEKHMATH